MKNRSSCAGWKEQLQSKIQEVDIGFQYKEIDSRQYCLLDRMEHSYIKIRGEIRVISMPLLYHAYVYLEFLILACTIYILASQTRIVIPAVAWIIFKIHNFRNLIKAKNICYFRHSLFNKIHPFILR